MKDRAFEFFRWYGDWRATAYAIMARLETLEAEREILRDEAKAQKIQFRVMGSDGGSGWYEIPEAEREPWQDIAPGMPLVFGNGWGRTLKLETRLAPAVEALT